MDAILPAMIGLGLWLAYEAWTNPQPHPVAKITAALTGSSANVPVTTGSAFPSAGTVAAPTFGGSVANAGSEQIHP